MATYAEKAYEQFKAAIGKPEGASEWFEVTQDRINAFADITDDHLFLHVDPERAAKEGPFGTTIAHGFMTLAMLTHLDRSIPRDRTRFEGVKGALNYGFDKVRFVAPVKVGARIRSAGEVLDVEQKGDNLLVKRQVTVEIDGEDRPAVVCEWLTRFSYR